MFAIPDQHFLIVASQIQEVLSMESIDTSKHHWELSWLPRKNFILLTFADVTKVKVPIETASRAMTDWSEF